MARRRSGREPRNPERAGEGVEQVGPAEESITVRLDATNIAAAGGEASALVWLAARMRALELGFSDEAAISVAEAIGAILDATSATVF